MSKKPTKDLDIDLPTTTTGEENGTARVYRGQAVFDHDLYKLELAKFMRNRKVLEGDADDYDQIEHVHHYHSVDSDGRKLNRCSAVGGHSHEMILVKKGGKNSPDVYRAGPPVREVRRKIKGRWTKSLEPLSYDQHTHDVKYVRSDRIEMRKTNSEAVNLQALEAQKTAPIPGVI